MQEQNYKNHGRMVKGFHYVLSGILVFTLILVLINLYQRCQANEGLLESFIFILLIISIILAGFFGRSFALKAQDRAIRAEENFRHFVLTGKPLDNTLKIGQIIALRFAPDSEFVALAKEALAGNLKSKEIKEKIQNWKADNNRV
jgi:hypothetical protein